MNSRTCRTILFVGALALARVLSAVEVSTADELAEALESMNPTATEADEIVLAAGTYDVSKFAQKYYDGGWKDSDSHLAVTKLTLRGATGDAADVILKGNETSRILHLVGGTVAHLTITGGSSTGQGGGVYCKNTTTTFTNVTVSGCKYVGTTDSDGAGGGGAYSGTWRDCRFVNNTSILSAGAAQGSVCYGCTFTGNVATKRAGGLTFASCYDCTFENNRSETSTGGCGYQTTFSNCTFRACSAPYGGAFTYATGAKAARDCTIIGCTATTKQGGATYSADLYNCTLIGNSSLANDGGAVQGGKLYDCTLISNAAPKAAGGGAIGCSVVSNCLFFGNSAKNGGGLQGCSGVFDCVVVSNRLEAGGTSGGGMRNCFATNCWIACNEGGGCASGYYANCTIVSNRTSGGGAAGCQYNSNPAIFSNCVAFANVSTGTSGTVGAFSGATLYDCIVRDNGYVTYGGGANNCEVFGGVFSGNDAYYGGAGYNCTFHDTVITNNRARSLGGASYSGRLERCRVARNWLYGTGDATKDCYGGGLNGGSAVDCVIEGNAIVDCAARYRIGGGCASAALTNCVIRNNYVFNGSGSGVNGCPLYGCVISNNVGGTAVRQGGAKVNCDIYENSISPQSAMMNCRIMGYRGFNVLAPGDNVYTNGTFPGEAYLFGSKLSCTNCLIAENVLPSSGYVVAGSSNDRFEFVNCTFASNRTDAIFAGFSSVKLTARAVNCIFDGNFTSDGTARLDFSARNGGYVALTNCLIGTARTTGVLAYPEVNTVTSDFPRFDTANAEHPYSLKRSSPARGRGLVMDWMADATDLRHDAAFPRLAEDGRVDIGCYQCWLPPMGIMLLVR